jgi:hypothetical protein
VVITDATALGRLWLPWCVHKEYPDIPIHIGEEPGLIPTARQIRVAEIEDERIRVALDRQATRHLGVSSLANITRSREALRESHTLQVLAFAVDGDEGLVLTEGCHRTCAIFLRNPEDFSVSVDLQTPWPVYVEHPELRSG